MSIIKTNVNINLNSIESKLSQTLNDPNTMTEVHQEFANVINPWIPKNTGRLADGDVRVDATGVTYYAPYASKCYYGDDIPFRTDKHPLATAHWDKVAMHTERAVFAQTVKEIIIRRYNNG